MRLELTDVGLLVELANHYTTRGASYVSVALLFYVTFSKSFSSFGENKFLELKSPEQLNSYFSQGYIIGKYRINYLSLAVNRPISALPWIGAHLWLFSSYITYSDGSKTIQTSIQITPVPRWTSTDKSGRKAIKFATNPLYFLNICLYNYIVLSSSSSELKPIC